MNKLERILKKKILLLDGATGTNLLDKGLAPGESPSILNVKNPQAVYDIHRAYVDAGSDVILTNTFTANPLNISSRELKKVITEGVKIAKRAAASKAIVIGDVGPLGELIRPYGEMGFNESYKIYCNIFKILYSSGIKTFLIETFTSIIEAKASFLAAKNFSKEIFISLSLQDNGRTIMGEIPESIAVVFEALGAKGVGINCTIPEVAIEAITKMAKITNLPLIIKPNAGKIKIAGNKIYHTLSDFEMAKYFKKFIQAGANIIGGCCGTSPVYIKNIARNKKNPKQRKVVKEFILASPGKILKVNDKSLIIVGERLNPSGRKKIKKRLKRGDFKVYAEEAKIQEQAGADALDINAFVVELDERETLENAVWEVLKNSQTPLFIDTQNFEVAQRVLLFYPGIGVYNSIPARKKELLMWLPMVKKFGFKVVVSLIGKKIPRSVKERLENVNLTLKIAKKLGFPKQDLIFDPLVFSVATEQEQINYTLETVARLHKRGLKTILGISNVSFGLPGRSLLNATLATAAAERGATFFILNPLDEVVMNSVYAAKVLFKGDISSLHTRARVTFERKSKNLKEAIIYGDDKLSAELAKKLLDSGTPAQELIDKYISQALSRVGDYYESGQFFIPDLLKSAEASQCVLTLVKKYLPKGKKKGKIVLATVKGDIHDIGKNIAGMIFESTGYEVIDLGKDMSCKKIIQAIKKHKPDAIGLSALLTTTMSEMENVISELRREKLDVKVIIGGPNVNMDYAKKIGAFGAARNVIEGLKILKTIK